jgi:hypothetical protein
LSGRTVTKQVPSAGLPGYVRAVAIDRAWQRRVPWNPGPCARRPMSVPSDEAVESHRSVLAEFT